MTSGNATSSRSERTRDRMWPLWVLFVLSGAAGLIHQVIWGRAFTPIFGGTTRAAAVVVSVFFLGMAAGNWLGGRWARDRLHSLRRYALAESLIAVGALVVLAWLALYRSLYPDLYAWGVDHPGLLSGAQILLALLAMGPPSVAIGVTLPLMAQVVTDRLGRMGLRVGGAYALNTLGATGGAVLAGFVLPGELGIRGSLILAAGVNAGVGFAAWVLFRMGSTKSERVVSFAEWETEDPSDAPPPRDSKLGAIAVVAGLSGLATLALEVFFVRLLVNQTDGSTYSFALILCVFLLSLALGAAACAALVDRVRDPWRIIAWATSVAALGTFLVPLGFDAGRGLIGVVRSAWGYWAGLALISAAVMAPTALLAGMVLPALWRMAPRKIRQVGDQVGRLTAVNTLAGVVGSLGAGFVLLPWLGIVRGFSVVALTFCVVACVAWVYSSQGASRKFALGVLAVGSGLLLWADGWQVSPLSLRPGEGIVHYEEGEGGAVAVTRLARGALRLRVNDRYTLTSTAPSSRRTQRDQTRLPLALLGEPRSVAFIGVGGAISMSALTEFPSVERVLAMELIPGVLRAAPYFESANRNILDDPRVEVLVADGRNHLSGRSERFDAVVGEVFSPWHAGTGYLYTGEHFEAVADRLSDQGVFVQWLQPDQFSKEEARVVAATFLDAFPGAELWMTQRSGPVPLLGLVGRAPGALHRDPAWNSATTALPARLCDAQQLADWTASAERNTDDRPIVEYRAGWARAARTRQNPSNWVQQVASACGYDSPSVGKRRPARKPSPARKQRRQERQRDGHEN